MRKQFLFFIGILLFSACHQEGFILIRNLDRAEWLTVEDFLRESGLSTQSSIQTTNQVSRKPSEVPQSSSLPQETKYMTIPENKDFTLQISSPNTLITLKSVSGVTYLKENSDPEQGLFAFRSASTNGRAHFQYYDLDGRLLKNVYYYFKIQKPSTTPTSTTNIATRKPTPTQPTETETQTNTNLPPRTQTQNIDWLLSSIRKLPAGEAIKNLESATADTTFSDSEKEQLNYTLIEYYLKQRLYTRASNRIETLQERGYQAYYRGLYYEAIQKPTRALEYLLQSLDIGGSVVPQAVVATGRVMINSGVSDATLVARLDNLTTSIKDPSLAAESMIQIAYLYEGLRNITRARQLYQTVISGNYPRQWKEKAQQELTTLNQQFR